MKNNNLNIKLENVRPRKTKPYESSREIFSLHGHDFTEDNEFLSDEDEWSFTESIDQWGF
jgi:hypothetical protein